MKELENVMVSIKPLNILLRINDLSDLDILFFSVVIACIVTYIDYLIGWGIFYHKAKKTLQSPHWDSIYSLEDMINHAIFAFEDKGEIYLVTHYEYRYRSQVEVIGKHGFPSCRPMQPGEEEIDNFRGYSIAHDALGLMVEGEFSMHTTYYNERKIEKTYDVKWLVQEYYDRIFIRGQA